jgi:hypothetical protein
MKPGGQKPEDQQKNKDKLSKEEKQSEQDKEKYGPTRNDQTKDGKPPQNTIGALYKKLLANGQWGSLPPKLRNRIRNSQAKEFPTRYRQILEKYYEKMGNVSRKSDE